MLRGHFLESVYHPAAMVAFYGLLVSDGIYLSAEFGEFSGLEDAEKNVMQQSVDFRFAELRAVYQADDFFPARISCNGRLVGGSRCSPWCCTSAATCDEPVQAHVCKFRDANEILHPRFLRAVQILAKHGFAETGTPGKRISRFFPDDRGKTSRKIVH